MIFSCYGCSDRTAYCHASCERYAADVARNLEEKKSMKDPLKCYYTSAVDQRKNNAVKRHRSGKGRLNTLKR